MALNITSCKNNYLYLVFCDSVSSSRSRSFDRGEELSPCALGSGRWDKPRSWSAVSYFEITTNKICMLQNICVCIKAERKQVTSYSVGLCGINLLHPLARHEQTESGSSLWNWRVTVTRETDGQTESGSSMWRCRVTVTSASYSRNPKFEIRLGVRLPWSKFFMVSLVFPGKFGDNIRH
jgi:hypothetical protein